jgi:hypothetical protein
VICKKCKDSGQLSTIRSLGTSQTLMTKDHFFDEQGDEHSHNPNIVTTLFRCSNGHRFQERSSWQCPCGWMACEATVTFLGEGAEGATQVVVAYTDEGTVTVARKAAETQKPEEPAKPPSLDEAIAAANRIKRAIGAAADLNLREFEAREAELHRRIEAGEPLWMEEQ